jgi:hypothetical protein
LFATFPLTFAVRSPPSSQTSSAKVSPVLALALPARSAAVITQSKLRERRTLNKPQQTNYETTTQNI